MGIITQLLKEFWLPLAIAAGWTLFNFPDQNKWVVTNIVNLFGTTFVFASYFTSQLFRVRNQQGVKKGLLAIETKVQSMLDELETKTKHLTDTMTGGDSVCYALLSINEGLANVGVVTLGRFPLYGVSMRFANLEVIDKWGTQPSLGHVREATTLNVQLGDLVPSFAKMFVATIPLPAQADIARFNIFFIARNGAFTQLLRLRKVDGEWVSATKVEKDGIKRHEQVHPKFPRVSSGDVDWN